MQRDWEKNTMDIKAFWEKSTENGSKNVNIAKKGSATRGKYPFS